VCLHAISITTNDSPLLLEDLINNFNFYLTNSCFVIHISRRSTFKFEEYSKLLTKFNNVILNPIQHETYWGNIFPGHFSNLEIIASEQSINSFGFHSTNDLLVKEFPPNFFKENSAGYHRHAIESDSVWFYKDNVLNDQKLENLNRSFCQSTIVHSQVEGTYFPSHIIGDFFHILKKFDLGLHASYPIEEIYLPTIARNLDLECNTPPYLFSEVCRFMDALESIKIRNLHLGSDKVTRAFNFFLRKANLYAISKIDVQNIRRHFLPSQHIIARNFSPVWSNYEIENLFAVKRVPRTLDSPLRMYINQPQD